MNIADRGISCETSTETLIGESNPGTTSNFNDNINEISTRAVQHKINENTDVKNVLILTYQLA